MPYAAATNLLLLLLLLLLINFCSFKVFVIFQSYIYICVCVILFFRLMQFIDILFNKLMSVYFSSSNVNFFFLNFYI